MPLDGQDFDPLDPELQAEAAWHEAQERAGMREDGPDAEDDAGSSTNTASSPFPVYSARQVLNLPLVPFRIRAFSLPMRGLGAIAGPSGHGKGLVIENLAMSIARARAFHYDLAVEPCAVGIIVAEGWSGIAGRQRAVYDLHGVSDTEDVPLYYIAASPQLDDPAAAEQVARSLRVIDPRPHLLFVDTYRATNSGDENDSTAVANYVRGLKFLAEGIDGFVCTVAHVPWNAERERGSTAFRAAMDWVALVMKEDDIITLSCLKSKDGPEFKPLRWRIEARADSATVVPIGDKEPDRPTPTRWEDIPANAQKVLVALAKDFGDDGAPSSQLQKASRVPESSFFRTIRGVMVNGFVEKTKSRYALTATGRGILP